MNPNGIALLAVVAAGVFIAVNGLVYHVGWMRGWHAAREAGK